MAMGSTVVVIVWRLLVDVAEDARKGVLRGVGWGSTVDLYVCHLEQDLMLTGGGDGNSNSEIMQCSAVAAVQIK